MAIGISLMWAILGAPTGGLGYPVWPAVLVLGIVCTYFTWWATFAGIRILGTAQVALLSPLETLLSVIWSFWLLGERFHGWQWVGAGFVLLSAVLASRRLTRVRVRIRWRAWMRP
jgi:drug/metabolite transporter (DMT)-like permease